MQIKRKKMVKRLTELKICYYAPFNILQSKQGRRKRSNGE